MEALALEASVCTRCPLAATRTQVVWGRGNPAADLVFVGEAPGADEDAQGQPFVGRSGRLLDRLVAEEMGLSDADFYVLNTLKCRPPGNRDPKPDELDACSGWFDAQLERLEPKVVVPLGNFATRRLLDTTEGITRLRGRTYPWRGRTLVPTYHPAAVLRGGAQPMAEMRADLVRAKLVLDEVAS
ncbi:MAG: phage polymerase-related protein [Ilumatobacteraceae bacterium]|nr:phage polymerase-related protein [Ilumatobacteraceae bacterium]